jgi:hypothetical protein
MERVLVHQLTFIILFCIVARLIWCCQICRLSIKYGVSVAELRLVSAYDEQPCTVLGAVDNFELSSNRCDQKFPARTHAA